MDKNIKYIIYFLIGIISYYLLFNDNRLVEGFEAGSRVRITAPYKVVKVRYQDNGNSPAHQNYTIPEETTGVIIDPINAPEVVSDTRRGISLYYYICDVERNGGYCSSVPDMNRASCGHSSGGTFIGGTRLCQCDDEGGVKKCFIIQLDDSTPFAGDTMYGCEANAAKPCFVQVEARNLELCHDEECDPVDCVESTAPRSTCTTDGQELYTRSTDAANGGAACTGSSTLCVAGDLTIQHESDGTIQHDGDGTIQHEGVPVDCLESTAARSTCTTVDQELYTRTTPAANGGTACIGSSTLCLAGDGTIQHDDVAPAKCDSVTDITSMTITDLCLDNGANGLIDDAETKNCADYPCTKVADAGTCCKPAENTLPSTCTSYDESNCSGTLSEYNASGNCSGTCNNEECCQEEEEEDDPIPPTPSTCVSNFTKSNCSGTLSEYNASGNCSGTECTNVECCLEEEDNTMIIIIVVIGIIFCCILPLLWVILKKKKKKD
jgi:hypothetical protein